MFQKIVKFGYNKKEAGISVKDHIFSLMCIHTDNSGDMGEFYKETPNEDKDSLDINNSTNTNQIGNQ